MEFSPYIIDGIVLLIVLFLAFMGYRKGFFFATFSFLPMLCAFIGVKVLTVPVASAIKKTVLYENLIERIGEKVAIDATFSERWMEPDLLSYLDMPDFLKEIIQNSGLESVSGLLDMEGISLFLAESIADVCVFIFSALLVYFVILIAGKLLLHFLDLMANLPVLSFFNQLFGAAIGGVQGVLWIWVIGIVLALQECSGGMQTIILALEDTKIASILYENNFLLQLMLQIFG